MKIFNWVLLLLLSLLWGGSFFFNEIILQDLPPFTLVFLRVSGGALLMWLYIILTSEPVVFSRKVIAGFIVLGTVNNFVPFSLIVWGQQFIEGGEASVLNAAAPLFGALIGHFVTRQERLTRNKIAGLLFGWGGVFLLMSTSFSHFAGLQSLQGRAAVISAALCYAIGATYGRRFKDISPKVLTAGMLSTSALFLLPLVLLVDKPWSAVIHTPAILALVGLAFLSTAVAYLIYYFLLARVGVTNLLLVTFLIPVTALFLGILFLGESPAWQTFGGLFLITAGLLIIDGRILNKKNVGGA
ncbi:MAG: EamA family transporter [Spirochaetes bacterium]|nr:MAG: EamA family transporter [Spirochaetota bacterium]